MVGGRAGSGRDDRVVGSSRGEVCHLGRTTVGEGPGEAAGWTSAEGAVVDRGVRVAALEGVGRAGGTEGWDGAREGSVDRLAAGRCGLEDGCCIERAASGCRDLFSNYPIEIFARPLCCTHDGEIGDEVGLTPQGNVLELLTGCVGNVLEFKWFSDAAGNLSPAGTVALWMCSAR